MGCLVGEGLASATYLALAAVGELERCVGERDLNGSAEYRERFEEIGDAFSGPSRARIRAGAVVRRCSRTVRVCGSGTVSSVFGTTVQVLLS